MGETLHGKYLIEEILGVGGMGMVFKATRLLIGDEIALKILFPKYFKSDLQRRLFTDEARSTAMLDHPNVICVYDADIDDDFGIAYIAMELLTGIPFKELMIAEAPMQPERLYPIFTQVCAGLSAAHQMNIVHRDLKPDNLFLCPDGLGGFDVKVLDFGIATVSGQLRKDEENKLLGTLRYMAPEQCLGEPSVPQTDLYALGVIVYESLTRQRASGKSIDAILYDPIIPPRERLPEDSAPPHRFEQLVMRLLSKAISDRPTSALEVKQELETIANPLNAALRTLPANKREAVEDEDWAHIEHTRVRDEDGQSVSLMWYILPISLLLFLLYLVQDMFT